MIGTVFRQVYTETAILSTQIVEARTVFVCAGHRVVRLSVSGASKAKLAMQVERCTVSKLHRLFQATSVMCVCSSSSTVQVSWEMFMPPLQNHFIPVTSSGNITNMVFCIRIGT